VNQGTDQEHEEQTDKEHHSAAQSTIKERFFHIGELGLFLPKRKHRETQGNMGVFFPKC
jgi:hypothetical protein